MVDFMDSLMTTTKMFEIGSWVVYPSHGVGKLDGIDKFDINGQEVEFFVISFPKNKLVLKLPVSKAIEAGLRQVINKEEMSEILEVLVQKTKKKRLMWSKRAQEYVAKINSGSPILLAEVIRDLYKDGGGTMLSFSERQIYQNAIERLAKEVAIVEETDELEAVKKLENILAA